MGRCKVGRAEIVTKKGNNANLKSALCFLIRKLLTLVGYGKISPCIRIGAGLIRVPYSVMRAHGLHMFYFSPVCPVYNVLIGLPRSPKICVVSKVSDLLVTAR